MLKGASISANISEVIAINCESTASSYANELAKLSKEAICIEYMYSFGCQGLSTLIIRTNDNEKAISAAEKYSINTLTQDELAKV